MSTPSLILVPARFKTGKLYTPLATTSGGVVLGASGDFNVTRATTATRVNANGLIESVASGIPRLDYYTSGGTAGCPALLVEPAATNFAPNANLMNVLDTPTVSGGVTFTTGSTDFLAPDGASGSINKYVGGNASGATQSTRYAGTSVAVSASGTYRFSLFVKAGATNPLNFCAIQFALFTGASGTATSYFSLASGTALTSGASIENYGNGWYRCISAPYTIAAGDLSGSVYFYLAEGNNDITWLASGALNLTAYTWGAQMEAGSVATSYIPTTTAAVTRNAEVITLSGAVSGCIGQTEGTLYWEGDALASGASDIFYVNRNVTNSVVLFKGVTNLLTARVYASGGTALTIADTVVRTGFLKLAIAYKSGDSTFYINGTRVGTLNTTAFTFTAALNTIRFGDDFIAGAGNQRCRAVALYSTRLTDSELAALTTL
jgi:hypothetical protein